MFILFRFVAAACGVCFHVMSFSQSHCCVSWVLSSMVISSLGKREICFTFRCFLCIIRTRLFTLPLGIIGRLCSVTLTLSGHILYCYIIHNVAMHSLGRRHYIRNHLCSSVSFFSPIITFSFGPNLSMLEYQIKLYYKTSL